MPTSAIAALRARSNTPLIDAISISMSRCSRLSAKSGACNKHGLAAELLGKPRREVVDVGVVLALYAAGQRNDGHVEGTLRHQVLHYRAYRLAAGDGDDVAVAQRLQQLVGGGAADLLDSRVRAAGHGRRNYRAGKPARFDHALLDI